MTKKIFQTFGVFSIVLGVYLFFWLSNISLGNFIDYVATKLSIESQRQALETYISSRLFSTLKYAALGLVLLGLLTIRYSFQINQFSRYLKHEFVELFFRIFQSFSGKYGRYFLIIFLAGVLIKIILILVMPIYYDEAWTYLYFTKLGILSSISFYPVPNNHVFHSILTNITYYFPFSQTTNLRIPNLVVSSISCIFLFYIFTHLFNQKISFYISSLYSFTFPVLYYGYCSRGYSLVLLAMIVCFYAAANLLLWQEKNRGKRDYYYLAIGNVIGLFAMPSYLYACISVFSFLGVYFLLQQRVKHIKELIVTFLGICTATALLYAPILAFSGLNSLTTNKYVMPYSRAQVLSELSNHFKETSIFLFQLPIWSIFVLAAVSIIAQIKHQHLSVLSTFSLYLLGISPFIVLIHSTTPFSRTWVHLLIPFFYILGYILNLFLIKHHTNKSTYFLNFSLVILLAAQLTGFRHKIVSYENFSFEADKAANYIMGKELNLIYINHYIIATNFLYIFEEKQKKIALIRSKAVDITTDELLLNSKANIIVTDRKIPETNGITLEQAFGNKIFVYKR